MRLCTKYGMVSIALLVYYSVDASYRNIYQCHVQTAYTVSSDLATFSNWCMIVPIRNDQINVFASLTLLNNTQNVRHGNNLTYCTDGIICLLSMSMQLSRGQFNTRPHHSKHAFILRQYLVARHVHRPLLPPMCVRA